MDILIATKDYEQWLSSQIQLVLADLRHKHSAMATDPFSFLRATYYRWAQQFLEMKTPISQAPNVLAVGDLHLENFGTWRDGLGRLAWGINDFDDAFPLPYTNDLVRLATSTLLSINLNHLRLSAKAACHAIGEGYREGIDAGGREFVIGDEHRWFKPLLQSPLRDPGLFWDKLRALPRERMALPPQAKAAIIEMLPDRRLPYELRHRVAGLGNLGKPRLTAVAHWQGGPVAREAKRLTLSAAGWAHSSLKGPYYSTILVRALRSHDPMLKVIGSWIVRRLAPDCRRLELSSLNRAQDEEWLLHAMGFEIANVHLGTVGARASIKRHLKDFPNNALRKTAALMEEALLKDFRKWQKDTPGE